MTAVVNIDGRDIGERSDAVLRTAKSGHRSIIAIRAIEQPPLLLLDDELLAIPRADVLGLMGGGDRRRVRGPGLAVVVDDLAVGVVQLGLAVGDVVDDAGQRMAVRLVLHALFPVDGDDAEVGVFEDQLVHARVGLVARLGRLRRSARRCHTGQHRRAERDLENLEFMDSLLVLQPRRTIRTKPVRGPAMRKQRGTLARSAYRAPFCDLIYCA